MSTIAAGLGWSHRELMLLEHRERRWWAERARSYQAAARTTGGDR